MASSRKSKKNPKTINRIAVALSGGLDSVVLLDSVCKASNPDQTEIWVFHIHHGLQKAADEWILFCEKLAKKYKVHSVPLHILGSHFIRQEVIQEVQQGAVCLGPALEDGVQALPCCREFEPGQVAMYPFHLGINHGSLPRRD